MSWEHGGVAMLAQGHGPQVNLWRAPVDNDVHLAKQWREAGYHELLTDARSVQVERASDGKSVYIRAELTLGVRGSRSLFAVTQHYTIFGNGELRIETRLEPTKEGLPPLPRIGLRFRIPRELESMAWFGRGPHECYADRKDSGKLGLYEGPSAEQFVPYIKPQENGSKADVRWAAFRGKEEPDCW
ncbi:hypothetical protein N6H14_23785 [Paenibacillus sp. CC-CFT747]|nr:hypothetical protein N6H14_23785 [Paenibacillus sp. CC-CFT747]